jgi:hexokinase
MSLPCDRLRFSYPAAITPTGEARLLNWTKGIQIENVEGTFVGAQLQEALRESGKQVVSLPVLNDTVASLLASVLIAPKCTHYLGLIVGTGTNIAGFFPVRRITKLAPDDRGVWSDDDEMAVNLESGNFTPPHLSQYDDMLDRSNLNDLPVPTGLKRLSVGHTCRDSLAMSLVTRHACSLVLILRHPRHTLV